MKQVAGVPVSELMDLQPIHDTLKICPHVECRFVAEVDENVIGGLPDMVAEEKEIVQEEKVEDSKFFMADQDWILHGIRK